VYGARAGATCISIGFHIAGKPSVVQQHALQDTMGVAKYKIGDVIDGTIHGVQNYGVFVEFGDGHIVLLHQKDISREPIGDVAKCFAVGDRLKAMVSKVDQDRRRISLSTRLLEQTPGDMLRCPELVYTKAEETAEEFRKRAQLKQVGG